MYFFFSRFLSRAFAHHLGQNLVLNSLQSTRLGEGFRVEGDAEALVDLDSQLDGHDGGQADITQHGGYTKVFGVDDLGDDAVDFLLQHIHRHIALHHGLGRFLFGLRKGFLVHLLVLVERDALNLHCHGRHHVRRFLVQDEAVQSFDVNLLISHDIGCDELTTALFVEGLHRCILDAGELKDDTFHLFQLDAEATDLHLTVLASHKLDVAVGEVAHDVASAVDVRVFLTGIEGVVDINLGHFLGTVEVAAGHLRSSDPQLTRHTHRQTVTRLVDDIKFHVVQRSANWDILHGLCHVEGGDADGAFGRTIEVHQRVVRGRSQRSQLLATGHQVAQAMVLNGSGELIGHLRGHESVSDMLLLKIFVQRYHVQAHLLRDNIKRGTSGETWIRLHHTGIESVTCVGRDFAVGRQVEPAPVPLAE